jgi:hypothetical protein
MLRMTAATRSNPRIAPLAPFPNHPAVHVPARAVIPHEPPASAGTVRPCRIRILMVLKPEPPPVDVGGERTPPVAGPFRGVRRCREVEELDRLAHGSGHAHATRIDVPFPRQGADRLLDILARRLDVRREAAGAWLPWVGVLVRLCCGSPRNNTRRSDGSVPSHCRPSAWRRETRLGAGPGRSLRSSGLPTSPRDRDRRALPRPRLKFPKLSRTGDRSGFVRRLSEAEVDGGLSRSHPRDHGSGAAQRLPSLAGPVARNVMSRKTVPAVRRCSFSLACSPWC